eukprot:TRINITY_DN11648_c0_g1_i1.p1 TRINITY_DN11648_c0_g1~~TRINITY_DN11648_c0_g1_i1.p1  ORF type:complete len:151 (+),score=55.63 TRINITY_DN11648_c0_g1_i1:64-453(+)
MQRNQLLFGGRPGLFVPLPPNSNSNSPKKEKMPWNEEFWDSENEDSYLNHATLAQHREEDSESDYSSDEEFDEIPVIVNDMNETNLGIMDTSIPEGGIVTVDMGDIDMDDIDEKLSEEDPLELDSSLVL